MLEVFGPLCKRNCSIRTGKMAAMATLGERTEGDSHRSRRTYIQTSPPNRPIKVTPADVDHLITGSFMKSPEEGSRFYTIIPGAHDQAQMPARPIQCSNEIKEEIRGHFIPFLRQIEKSGCKDDFQIGIEARFGRQYQELWNDSERKQSGTVAHFKPNLLTHKLKNFYTGLREGEDLRPILDKYCEQDRKKEAKIISMDFELDSDPHPNSKQIYTVYAREVKHGEFELKCVVQYKPKEQMIGPERHDIVLPGRKYDIRIGHNSGPNLLSAPDSLSYKAAVAIVKSMERKGHDASELTLMLTGEVGDGKDKTKYHVTFIRYKVQIQYPWKGEGRLVLAEHDVKQRKIQRSNYGAVGERCDIRFHPENCRKELELWGEKFFPQHVDQTKPTRSEYLYMQSCVTPLQLEGEEEPVPPRPWQTAEELMEDFDALIKAAFDVANALE